MYNPIKGTTSELSTMNLLITKNGINHFYSYVSNNPVNKIDPLGLYETLFGECISCDNDRLSACLERIQKPSPSTALNCFICIYTKNPKACGDCFFTYYINVGQCYTDHCKKKDCCEK